MSWSSLADWWRDEVASDSAYDEVVTPLLVAVLKPVRGHLYLDLGCGEGRVMREMTAAGAVAHGIDVNFELVSALTNVVVARLPAIPIKSASYDGVYSVLSLEHIEDHATMFSESARVVREGGVMGVVMNHPVWTAPDSTPIGDSDGETLWRPGSYFGDGVTSIPAGSGEITFYHRSMSSVLNAAARSGWRLDMMVEQPHHEIEDQAGVPRLLGCRWVKAH